MAGVLTDRVVHAPANIASAKAPVPQQPQQQPLSDTDGCGSGGACGVGGGDRAENIPGNIAESGASNHGANRAGNRGAGTGDGRHPAQAREAAVNHTATPTTTTTTITPEALRPSPRQGATTGNSSRSVAAEIASPPTNGNTTAATGDGVAACGDSSSRGADGAPRAPGGLGVHPDRRRDRDRDRDRDEHSHDHATSEQHQPVLLNPRLYPKEPAQPRTTDSPADTSDDVATTPRAANGCVSDEDDGGGGGHGGGDGGGGVERANGDGDDPSKSEPSPPLQHAGANGPRATSNNGRRASSTAGPANGLASAATAESADDTLHSGTATMGLDDSCPASNSAEQVGSPRPAAAGAVDVDMDEDDPIPHADADESPIVKIVQRKWQMASCVHFFVTFKECLPLQAVGPSTASILTPLALERAVADPSAHALNSVVYRDCVASLLVALKELSPRNVERWFGALCKLVNDRSQDFADCFEGKSQENVLDGFEGDGMNFVYHTTWQCRLGVLQSLCDIVAEEADCVRDVIKESERLCSAARQEIEARHYRLVPLGRCSEKRFYYCVGGARIYSGYKRKGLGAVCVECSDAESMKHLAAELEKGDHARDVALASKVRSWYLVPLEEAEARKRKKLDRELAVEIQREESRRRNADRPRRARASYV